MNRMFRKGAGRRVKDDNDPRTSYQKAIENTVKNFKKGKATFESVFNEGNLNPVGYPNLQLDVQENMRYTIYTFEHPDISSIVNANHSCGSQRIDSLLIDIYQTALKYVKSENRNLSDEEADSLAWDLIINDYGYYIQYRVTIGLENDGGFGVFEINFYINLETKDGRKAQRQKVVWKVLGLDYLHGIEQNAQEIVDKINSINFGSEQIEYGSHRVVSDSRKRVKDDAGNHKWLANVEVDVRMEDENGVYSSENFRSKSTGRDYTWEEMIDDDDLHLYSELCDTEDEAWDCAMDLLWSLVKKGYTEDGFMFNIEEVEVDENGDIVDYVDYGDTYNAWYNEHTDQINYA